MEVTIAVASGYSGKTQIELIQQLSDGASPYSEGWDGGFQALHHICIRVEDVDIAVERFEQAGLPIVMDIVSHGARYVYLDTSNGRPGGFIELSPTSEASLALHDKMRSLHENWGGENPTRPFAELF